MNRDSVPAIITVIALALIAIATWVICSPPALSDGCYLQARPRHRVGAPQPMLTPDASHCTRN